MTALDNFDDEVDLAIQSELREWFLEGLVIEMMKPERPFSD